MRFGENDHLMSYAIILTKFCEDKTKDLVVLLMAKFFNVPRFFPQTLEI